MWKLCAFGTFYVFYFQSLNKKIALIIDQQFLYDSLAEKCKIYENK